MKYLESYKVFERKGNYQLFHKCISIYTLDKILKSGFIISGGEEQEFEWDNPLRKNVIHNWGRGKFKTISATRNFDYLGLPTFELDVEKISDKYKIIPYIENLDYYLDNFIDADKLKPTKIKHLNNLQNQLRSKSKNAGKAYWKVKTQKDIFDFGIAEEIILTDKLDISKYVKRIILEKGGNDKIIKIIKEKYPNIEVIEVDKHDGYSDIKTALKQKEKVKEPVLERIFTCLTPDRKLEVGDYIKIFPRDDGWYSDVFNEYIKNHIGRITEIEAGKSILKRVHVSFLPMDTSESPINQFFYDYEISASAKTIKKLQEIISTDKAMNKYNL
jgi:hypothetical protein